MKKVRKRIHFIKTKLKKARNNLKSNKFKKDQSGDKIGKFLIKKGNSVEFDPKINYYDEYWKVYSDNEYYLAKIKEVVYEINLMKEHIEQLKNIK